MFRDISLLSVGKEHYPVTSTSDFNNPSTLLSQSPENFAAGVGSSEQNPLDTHRAAVPRSCGGAAGPDLRGPRRSPGEGDTRCPLAPRGPPPAGKLPLGRPPAFVSFRPAPARSGPALPPSESETNGAGRHPRPPPRAAHPPRRWAAGRPPRPARTPGGAAVRAAAAGSSRCRRSAPPPGRGSCPHRCPWVPRGRREVKCASDTRP